MGKRRAKSLKNVSFVKYSEVLIDGIEIPLISRSIQETLKIKAKLSESIDLPKETKFATPEEREILIATDPSYDPKKPIMVVRYDSTDPEYKQKTEELVSVKSVLDVVQYIDLDAENEQGQTLWQELGLVKDDWMSFVKYCTSPDGFGFTDQHLEKILVEVKKMQGETVYTMLSQLQALSGKSPYEVLTRIKELDSMDEKDRELQKKELELQKRELKIEELETIKGIKNEEEN